MLSSDSNRGMKTYNKELYISGFEYNVQELATLLRRKQAHQIVDESHAAKYEFELHGYHTEDATLLATHYGSDTETGLTDQKAAQRLQEQGHNSFRSKHEWPGWAKLLLSMISGFNPLLWACVVLDLISWQPLGAEFDYYYSLILAIILIVVIVLSSLFTFYQVCAFLLTSIVLYFFSSYSLPALQERRVSIILRGLTQRDEQLTCIVIRSGQEKEVSIMDIVVGDIVMLKIGSKVPADIRIIDCEDMHVDTSMLTGETRPVKITAAPLPETVSYLEAWNTVFMGSSVVQGHGKGIVIAVGCRTQVAKVTQECGRRHKPTAVQNELQNLLTGISICTTLVVIVAVIFWICYIRVIRPDYRSLSNLFVDLVTLVVAIVPICLPLAVGLGITMIARRLIGKYHLIVKQLGNTILLGAITLLACDKTGTLTQDRAYVAAVLSATALKSKQDGETKLHDIPGASHIINASYRIAALCNQAKLQIDTVSRQPTGDLEYGQEMIANETFTVVGSKSVDRALLQWVKNQSDVHFLLNAYTVQVMMPFNAELKISTAVVTDNMTHEATVLMKGAPEIMVARCSYYMDVYGVIQPMTEQIRLELMLLIDHEASKCRSMIAMAQCGPLPFTTYPADYEYTVEPEPNFPLTGLTFVSCAAIADPLAEGVVEAIQQLRGAGIFVTMVTGDSASTAIAVAREVGILSDRRDHRDIHTLHSLHGSMSTEALEGISMLVLGRNVDTMSAVEWDYVFHHKEIVFARTTPAQKLQIVSECQKRGFVVGVTGDGVNDCPALSDADIGIAVNKSADVAREVAEVVLLDNSFYTIVHGVREGRIKFDNLRKVVAYLMAGCCWAQLMPLIATFFLGLPKPISAFNIILNSVLCDVFGSVALMYEPQEEGVMQRPPRNVRQNPLVSWPIIFYSFYYGSLIAFGAFFNYFHFWFSKGFDFRDLLFVWFRWAPDSFTYVPVQKIVEWTTSSSIFFMALVIGQMVHQLSVRRRKPYFYHEIMGIPPAVPPNDPIAREENTVLRELWHESFLFTCIQWPIVFAWLASIATMFFFLYIPIFHHCCRTASVSAQYWGMSFGWALLWLALFEFRKWLIVLYPNSWFSRDSW